MPPDGPARAGGTTPPVLVVDDSDVARHLLARALGASGLPCDARASLSAVRAAPPEGVRVALLDLELPDGDGVAVAELVRARSPGVEVAFFSGGASDELRARAARLGPVFAKGDGLAEVVAWARARG